MGLEWKTQRPGKKGDIDRDMGRERGKDREAIENTSFGISSTKKGDPILIISFNIG